MASPSLLQHGTQVVCKDFKVAAAHAVSASEGSRGKIKLEKFPPGLKIKGVFKGTLVIQQNLLNSEECFEAHSCILQHCRELVLNCDS